MISFKKSWKEWSLFEKISVIGVIATVLGVLISALVPFFQNSSNQPTIEPASQNSSKEITMLINSNNYFGESGYMNNNDGYIKFHDSSNIDLQVGGFIKGSCSEADACTRISIVSSKQSHYIIDSFYIKLHRFINCDLRNEITTIGAIGTTSSYQYYISEHYSRYDIIPIRKMGIADKWMFKGNDYEELQIFFYFKPYTLYIISFELVARNVKSDSLERVSSEKYPLIKVSNGNTGGCLNLTSWFDESKIITAAQKSYRESLTTSEYQLLICNFNENPTLIAEYNNSLLRADINNLVEKTLIRKDENLINKKTDYLKIFYSKLQ